MSYSSDITEKEFKDKDKTVENMLDAYKNTVEQFKNAELKTELSDKVIESLDQAAKIITKMNVDMVYERKNEEGYVGQLAVVMDKKDDNINIVFVDNGKDVRAYSMKDYMDVSNILKPVMGKYTISREKNATPELIANAHLISVPIDYIEIKKF